MRILGRFHHSLGDFMLDAAFELPGRGVTGIQGPSGAGKTSLLRAIAGLDRSPGGELTVNGEAWQDRSTFVPAHRRRVGYVFQDCRLFPHRDVRGNLTYAAKRAPAGSEAHLDQAIGLLGLGPLLGRDTTTLSGGERRRVAIARALAAAPALLLLDEPFSGIDADRRESILPWLEALQRSLEIPVLLVSHDSADIDRLADQLLLMRDGRIVASGPVQAVLTDPSLPPAHSNDAATVINASVESFDGDWGLNRLATSGGCLLLPGEPLVKGSRVKVRVSARDVSISRESLHKTSILNSLRAIVDRLEEINPSQVVVRLRSGDDPYLAHITRRSVAALDLAPGDDVFIQVKSLALIS